MDVISLIVLGVAAAAGAAVLAATLASTTVGAAFWTVLGTWIAADISGFITIAPLVLITARRADSTSPWTPGRVAEGVLMLCDARRRLLFFLTLFTSVESTQRSARLHRELALQLQSAADSERSRLAHELHDDVAQKLAALKMQLELDDLTAHRGRSNDAFVGAVDHLIADVRALLRSMRPAPFMEGQLIPALATLARTEGRRAGLRVLVDARVDDVRLSREVELACYRVVREAVANIIKHARAHHLAVSALTHSGVFAVRVVDDGTGFDVAPARCQAVLDGHPGLMGMLERVEQVGGTLKIRSRRGGGTMVECCVPVMTTV